MRRPFGLSLVATTIAFTLTVIAAEKPTKEYQDIMRSNGAIVDITLGTDRGGFIPTAPTSLRVHINAKDYDGIGKDAATLKANMVKVEAFWTQRNVDDAINFSKAAQKAASDLETAAKAKDDAGIAAAHSAIATTCINCHLAHRVIVLVDRSFEII